MSGWKERFEDIDAVLFDLGNTLVAYYTPQEFFPVLERCIGSVAELLTQHRRNSRLPLDIAQLYERAKGFNQERPDGRVWPLPERLAAIFAGAEGVTLSDALLQQMSERFVGPIFETAKLNPDAIPVLRNVRALGLKCAIVSNTPWGSSAPHWRAELARWDIEGARRAGLTPILFGEAPAHAAYKSIDRLIDLIALLEHRTASGSVLDS